MNRPLIIYHKNCADGFGAAWAAKQALPDAEFYPATHGEVPPDVTGREVFILDFSYKRPVLILMAKQAKSIIIIDHHKSAERDLVELPENVNTIFNMDKSGAVLALEYFFPNKSVPILLDYIQDRDLWKFVLPKSREIAAAVFSYPYDFAVWDELVSMVERDAGITLSVRGSGILCKQEKDIAEFLKVAAQEMELGLLMVPVVNCPYMWGSDAAHILCEGMPFAAYYWDSDGYRNFGLRSREGGEDVSKIAAKYGGGGHEHAAGFRIKIQDISYSACSLGNVRMKIGV